MRGIFGLLTVVCAMLFVAFGVTAIVNNVSFSRNVSGYLKRAADSNSIELAANNLTTALRYIEENQMTSGSTYVLWTTPGQDVGFWYTNLKSALKDLQVAKPETTPLERSNMLIKLRETLLDHGKDGDMVTAPPGISFFPNNKLFFYWGWLSFIFGAICFLGLLQTDD